MFSAIMGLIERATTSIIDTAKQLRGSVRSLFVTDRNIFIKTKAPNADTPRHAHIPMFEAKDGKGGSVTFSENDLLDAIDRPADIAREYTIDTVTMQDGTRGELIQDIEEEDVTWTFTPQPREHLDVYLLQEHALVFSLDDIFENIPALFPGQDLEALLSKSILIVPELDQGQVEQQADGTFKFTPRPRTAEETGIREFKIKLSIGSMSPEAAKSPETTAAPELAHVEVERTITVTEVVKDPKHNLIINQLPRNDYWILPDKSGKESIIDANDPKAVQTVDEYNETSSRKALLMRSHVKEHRPLILFKDDLVYVADVKDNPWWSREHRFTVSLRDQANEGQTVIAKTLVINSAPRPTPDSSLYIEAEHGVPLLLNLESLNLDLPEDVSAELLETTVTAGVELESDAQGLLVVPPETATRLIQVTCTVTDDRSVSSKLFTAIRNYASATKDRIVTAAQSFAANAANFASKGLKLSFSTVALAVGLFFLGGGLLTPFYYATALELLLVPLYLAVAVGALKYAGPAATLLAEAGIATVKTLFTLTKNLVTAVVTPLLNFVLMRSGFAEEAAKRPLGKYYARGVIPWNAQLERDSYPNPSMTAGANFDVVRDFGPARLTLPILGFRWEYPDRPERFRGYVLRIANQFLYYSGLHAHAKDLWEKHEAEQANSAREPLSPQDLEAALEMAEHITKAERQHSEAARAAQEQRSALETAYKQKTKEKEARLHKTVSYAEFIAQLNAKDPEHTLQEVSLEESKRLAATAAEISHARKIERARENRARITPLLWLHGSDPNEQQVAEERQVQQQIQTTAGGAGGSPAEPGAEEQVRDRTGAPVGRHRDMRDKPSLLG